MSNCQKDNKKPIDGDGSTVAITVDEKPIGNVLLITTVAATAAGIFFGLRTIGMGQHNPLLISTSLAWLISLLVWKR